MYIPDKWVRAAGKARMPDGRELPTAVWGWGDDEESARQKASSRLEKLLARLRRGEPFPEKYTYDDRPVREEILDVLSSEDGEAEAIVTRNRHGVEVLNTRGLLFLDIDLPVFGGLQALLAKFGLARDRSAAGVLTQLKETLGHKRGTFRLYRTSAGFRVMAVDRDFDPSGHEAAELMKVTQTDPSFVRLCTVQKSFRARLTPKPWRCKSQSPPVAYPRDDHNARQRFAAWLAGYENACQGFATCKYLETVGKSRPASFARPIIELHDRKTRCNETLPLA